MLSNNCPIELTFNNFYIVFGYYWFIELQLNWYMLFLFIRLFIHQIFLSGVLLCLIWNILQIICSSLILLIFDFCVSSLLYQRSLILKLVLGCDLKLSVGRIQTGHTYLLPPQFFVRLWRGCWFLWFPLLPSINWFDSRQLLNFLKCSVVQVSVGTRGKHDHWVNCLQMFSFTY